MCRGVRPVRSCFQLALSALVVLAAGALIARASAQICTVAGNPSTVTLASGSCTIAPNTTLNGTPAVHAITSAQITTNNVNINPFNVGSIGFGRYERHDHPSGPPLPKSATSCREQMREPAS